MLKIGIASLPVVGPVLAELLFDCRSRIKQERIIFLLRQAMADLDRSKIDFDYLQTEEFGDHLEDILKKIAENRSQRKNEHFKTILLASIQGKRQPDLSRLFLNIMGEVSDREIELFSFLYRVHEGKETYSFQGQVLKWFFPEERVKNLCLDMNEFKLLTLSLGCRGLILDDHFGEAFGQYASSSNNHSRITPLGLGFYTYITGT
ncbi:MAG TPA: hypothetical protein DCQ33_11860 [Nitrospira sp.]|nr:hypothetical protein [Nitrospira sp.]